MEPPTSSSKKNTGLLGENIAVRYLQDKGYTIRTRNWTDRWAELDIVAEKDKTLVFIEVKTRKGTTAGTPEDQITIYKRLTLWRSMQRYLIKENLREMNHRLDILAIQLLNDRKYRLKHYKNIDISG